MTAKILKTALACIALAAVGGCASSYQIAEHPAAPIVAKAAHAGKERFSIVGGGAGIEGADAGDLGQRERCVPQRT